MLNRGPERYTVRGVVTVSRHWHARAGDAVWTSGRPRAGWAAEGAWRRRGREYSDYWSFVGVADLTHAIEHDLRLLGNDLERPAPDGGAIGVVQS